MTWPSWSWSPWSWSSWSSCSQESGTWASVILPTNRGFHSHYGFWNAEEDYWSKRALDWENFYGYDFHENLEITREPAGIYSTEVYAARAEQIIR